MASYAMTGPGIFGGSNNFLSHLGGIAAPWGDAMTSGMNMGSQLIDYKNKVDLNPSRVNAEMARNINAKDVSEGDHYVNYMMNQVLSKLAGGKELDDYQKNLLQSGVVNLGSGVNTSSLVSNVQGTPNITQTNSTPATTVTQPVQQPMMQKPLPGGQYNQWSDVLNRLGGRFR